MFQRKTPKKAVGCIAEPFPLLCCVSCGRTTECHLWQCSWNDHLSFCPPRGADWGAADLGIEGSMPDWFGGYLVGPGSPMTSHLDHWPNKTRQSRWFRSFRWWRAAWWVASFQICCWFLDTWLHRGLRGCHWKRTKSTLQVLKWSTCEQTTYCQTDLSWWQHIPYLFKKLEGFGSAHINSQECASSVVVSIIKPSASMPMELARSTPCCYWPYWPWWFPPWCCSQASGRRVNCWFQGAALWSWQFSTCATWSSSWSLIRCEWCSISGILVGEVCGFSTTCSLRYYWQDGMWYFLG